MIKLSLRQYLMLALMGMLVTVILSYTLIADSYFKNGIDTLTRFIIRDLHEHYAPLIDANRPYQQPTLFGFSLATEYDRLPDNVKMRLSTAEIEVNQLRILLNTDPAQEGGVVLLMKLLTPAGREVFYLRQVDPAHASSANEQDIRKSMVRLMLISATALLLSLTILIMLYSAISRPLQRLIEWARKLGPNSLDHPHPDFLYTDVNKLADMVQDSLQSARDTLNREHEFLRHASHELRTPLAVISSNLQLLDRFSPPDNDICRSSLERINRATENMSQLSETLLWLSRDDAYQPARTKVQLDQLINELIEANRYLIAGKAISFETELASCCRELPLVPCRIVISNLIRNACQHTPSGVISIRLTPDAALEIRNDRPDERAPSLSPDGFGLGLQLVSKVCNRFAWSFSQELKAQIWTARLVFLGSKIST